MEENNKLQQTEKFWNKVGSKNGLMQIMESTTYPSAFFAADGTAMFFNRVFCNIMSIVDPDELMGKYNVFTDSDVNNNSEMREFLQKIMKGETATMENTRTPLTHDPRFTQKYQINEFKRQNVIGFPIFDENGKIEYFFITGHAVASYKGRDEVIRAQEYMNANWVDEYDIEKIAEHSGVSSRHLSRLFKQSTGEAPLCYYKQIKITRLKEALKDPNNNVESAFKACGMQ